MSEYTFDGAPYIVRLEGCVQSYPWGAVGAASRIAPFLRSYGALDPLAEFWIGAHPKGPSRVVFESGEASLLSALIEAAPREVLGEAVVRRFGAALPFLLKVLSVNPAFGLSIQAHPDRARAERLHRRDPQHYPDPNHKPEVVVALSEVSLLYGFRPLPEVASVVRRYPGLAGLLGDPRCHALWQAAEGRQEEELGNSGVLQDVVRHLFRSPASAIAGVVEGILAQCGVDGALEGHEGVFLRLAQQYERSDVGLLALFLMNLVRVAPGCALYTAPNVPHAYLSGNMVECMACSDNVVRAGLTPKFRDIETLLGMLEFRAHAPEVIVPTPGDAGFLVVPTPTEEFQLSFLPCGSGKVEFAPADEVRVALVLGDRAVVRQCGVFDSEGDGAGSEIRLGDGGAILIRPGGGKFELERRDAAVYLVSVGCQMPV